VISDWPKVLVISDQNENLSNRHSVSITYMNFKCRSTYNSSFPVMEKLKISESVISKREQWSSFHKYPFPNMIMLKGARTYPKILEEPTRPFRKMGRLGNSLN